MNCWHYILETGLSCTWQDLEDQSEYYYNWSCSESSGTKPVTSLCGVTASVWRLSESLCSQCDRTSTTEPWTNLSSSLFSTTEWVGLTCDGPVRWQYSSYTICIIVSHSPDFSLQHFNRRSFHMYRVCLLTDNQQQRVDARPASEPSEPQNIIRTANRRQRDTRESIKSPESPFIVRGPAEYHLKQIWTLQRKMFLTNVVKHRRV